MKDKLAELAAMANEIGRDYDPELDDIAVEGLVKLLGSVYPICVLEAVIKSYQAKLREIENTAIPDLLLESGCSEVTTVDGLKVTLTTEYNGKIVDEDYAYSWMSGNGSGHLWETALKFKKGENIDQVKIAAREAGISYEEKSSIHHQTLAKFLRDYMKSGGPTPPEEAIKVGVFTHAKIKRSLNA